MLWIYLEEPLKYYYILYLLETPSYKGMTLGLSLWMGWSTCFLYMGYLFKTLIFGLMGVLY